MTSDTTETRFGQAVATIDRQALTFSILREFDAPRELVFDAFSTCDALKHWLAPADWTLPFCEMDFRPGGSCRYTMRAPAGTVGPEGEDPWEAFGKSRYEQIERPEHITYRDALTDEHYEPVDGMPEMHVTISFIDLGNGRTNLINTTQFDSLEALAFGAETGMDEGWASSLDNLAAYLATNPG